MNLANKLTLLRVILIPFFVFFILSDVVGEYSKWLALAIFAIASITDFFDGKIARKYNMVTNFGKFMDPLADKLLVCSAMICFAATGQMPAWIVIIILCRELAVDGLRMVAVTKGQVIAAGPLGKWKTACQMILISAMLILNLSVYQCWPLAVLAGIVVLLTLISGVDYFVRNISVISEK